MSEALTIAIMQMVVKVGIDATVAFLKNRGATIDQAIVALEIAGSMSLDQYIKKDAAERSSVDRPNK